ncbi:MAG: short-chain dehydrogenase [Deltaproteobacteria bacterium]|nr:short-chain dehydrogenase [Deltaproteobacteria bacterium]
MDLGIKGKKAIVNGGSAGMGRSSVLALAREGVEVFVSARGEERLSRACVEIASETGAKVTPIAADHSSEEGRNRILAACPEPDILVHTCSPPQFTGDFKAITEADWHASLGITLLGPIQFMQKLLPGMAARGWGRVVNIGTAGAKFPHERRVLSGAPRAALVNYTVAVSKVVAKDNVTINNIMPGMFHTPGLEVAFAEIAEANGTSYDEEVENVIREHNVAAGKFGDPDDLGAFVAMFCSQYASYLVGQSLAIEGGVTNSTF